MRNKCVRWLLSDQTMEQKRNWLFGTACETWTGRKIANRENKRVFQIGKVKGENHIEVEHEGRKVVHTAHLIRARYVPSD